MDWIGLGPKNWTHVQIWYASHYHLVNFRRTWLLYNNGISQDQKPIVKISGGNPNSRGISTREPFLE